MIETLPTEFGRYRLVERLAIGGMAVLYKATLAGAHDFHKHLVIKRIHQELAEDPQFSAMFIDEAKLAARLQHPKIVQVFELGALGDELFIAMELVEGTDLLDVLRFFAAQQTFVAASLAAHIAHEILDALDYAHTATGEHGEPLELVHRDVSPGNVLISQRGDIKLTDFGIARAATNQAKTQSGTLKGKYSYMAPEQVVGGDLDCRVDVFGVGILLAEMCMGRRLFSADSDLDVLLLVRDANLARLDKHGAHIDGRLRKILYRALQRDRDARYQTARDFREALADWLFETRQRIGAGDVAATIKLVLEGRRAPASDQFPRANTLSGPDTLRKGVELAQAAAVGRAWFEEKMGHGAPAASSDADDLDYEIQIEPQATPEPTRPPTTDDVLALISSLVDVIEPVAPASRSDGFDEHTVEGTSHLIQASHGEDGFDERTVDGSSHLGAPSDGFDDEFDDEFDEGEEWTRAIPSDAPRPAIEAPAARVEDASIPPHFTELVDDLTPDGLSDLSETPAIRLLYGLAAQNATGLLVASTSDSTIEKRVYFVEGVPQYVESNLEGDLFGEFLVSRGKLSSGELAMAMAVLPHFGGKLGNTLVGLGLLTAQEALVALADQIRSKLVPLCTWTTGTFRWYRNRRFPRELQPLHIDLCEVLGAASQQLEEPVLVAWSHERRDLVLSPVDKPKIPPERYGLGKRMLDIANLLEGGRTLTAIYALCPTPTAWLDTLRMLFLMEQTGLATWPRAPTVAEIPPPRESS